MEKVTDENTVDFSAMSDSDFEATVSKLVEEEAAQIDSVQDEDYVLKSEEATPDDESGVEQTDDEHDPLATLNEDAPEAKPEKEEAKEVSKKQFQIDAENIAKKWDNLTSEERAKKVKNLAKNRPKTFEALAQELGSDSKLLSEQFELDVTDISQVEELDLQTIRQEAYEKAKNDLLKEQEVNATAKEANRNRFVSEVQNFAKHNNLGDDFTKKISSLDSELFNSFDSIKFDPKTGEQLSMKGRLKLALNGNEEVKNALIDAKAKNQSKKILSGVNAGLPPIKGSASVKSNQVDIDEIIKRHSGGHVLPIE